MLIVYLNPCILSSAPLSLILRSGNTTSSPVPIWSALLLPAASLIITAEVALPIPSVRFQYEQDEPLSETKPSRLGLGHGGVIGGGRRRGVRHDDGAPILARSTCSTPPLPLDFGRRCEPLVCAPDTSLPIRFEGSSLHHGRVKGMRFAAKGNVKSEAKERIESILGPLPDPIADLTTASRTYDSGDFVTALTDAIAFLFAVERKQKDQAAFENRLSGVPCLSRSAGGGAFSVVSGRGQAFSKWFVWDMPKPPVSTGGHVTVLCPDEATARRQAMEFASSSAFYNKGNSLFNLPARYLAKRAEAGNARQFPIDDAIPGLAMRWFRKGGPAEVDAIHDAVATGKLTRRFKFDGDDVTVPVPEGQSADTSAFKANLNKLKAVVQEAEYLLMTPHEFVEKETGRRALKYSMYRVRQLDVDFQPVVINPYWLGLWLGDGNRRNTVIFNFHESEIRAFLIQYAELLDKPDKTALGTVPTSSASPRATCTTRGRCVWLCSPACSTLMGITTRQTIRLSSPSRSAGTSPCFEMLCNSPAALASKSNPTVSPTVFPTSTVLTATRCAPASPATASTRSLVSWAGKRRSRGSSSSNRAGSSRLPRRSTPSLPSRLSGPLRSTATTSLCTTTCWCWEASPCRRMRSSGHRLQACEARSKPPCACPSSTCRVHATALDDHRCHGGAR